MSPMTQSLLSVVVFIAMLALVPWAIRWAPPARAGTPSAEAGEQVNCCGHGDFRFKLWR